MKGRKAVIVDDDRLNRQMVSMALGAEGYSTFQAGDAVAGFREIERNEPDLIIIDVVLPGELDGVALCSLVKKQRLCENAAIVMITASDRRREADRSIAAGADMLIGKPFSPKQFMSQIGMLMRDKGMTEQ